MKEIFGIKVDDEKFNNLIYEQSQGKDLIIQNGDVIAVEHQPTQDELNQIKLRELDNWFKTQYREYNEMLTRRKELGIEDTIVDNFRNKTYHNLIELYEEAELVAGEIRELRKNVK